MKKIIKLILVTMSFTAMSFVGVSCNKKMQEQKQIQNRIDKALAELNDMILKIENAYNAENGVIAKAEKKYQDVLKELKEDDKIKVKSEFRKYKENIVKNSQLFLEVYNLNFKTIVFEKTLPFLKTSNKQTKKLKEFFAMLYQVSQG